MPATVQIKKLFASPNASKIQICFLPLSFVSRKGASATPLSVRQANSNQIGYSKPLHLEDSL